MTWIDFMFLLGLTLGYLIGWARHRLNPLRRVFFTRTPDAFPLGSVERGWRVISLDREASTRPVDGGSAPRWRVTMEAAE